MDGKIVIVFSLPSAWSRRV